MYQPHTSRCVRRCYKAGGMRPAEFKGAGDKAAHGLSHPRPHCSFTEADQIHPLLADQRGEGELLQGSDAQDSQAQQEMQRQGSHSCRASWHFQLCQCI